MFLKVLDRQPLITLYWARAPPLPTAASCLFMFEGTTAVFEALLQYLHKLVWQHMPQGVWQGFAAPMSALGNQLYMQFVCWPGWVQGCKEGHLLVSG
jgi:hypothetical protein